ncbi:RNA 2',3'-cyclic phosphodiesterase [Metallosphaera tengchongensis]|uniref:RNA 2',3'-cyclic phosphodiesterase n=1 Tax=Metallosphaera tengchongensis TaxID=1532350 RepID=A0A6N0NU44_9CREN|nr:RNA 2',3'-cyclic phosphodiesterase [Metallosphaera tengchongensis]QKQ99422.1 RNA 2',3'-cyclic phosphodiesterase [Metallosphaera tengchongensis]
MRLFVGIPVEDSPWLREALSLVERTGVDIKLVEPQNVHVTLAFLGEVPEGKVGLVKESLEELSFSPFKMAFRGMGAFPSISRPRVVWIGITEGSNEIRRMRNSLVKSLSMRRVRVEEEQFVPHVTLGRIKGPRGVQNLALLVEQMSDRDFGEQEVREVVLFKSTLTPKGPIYEEVHRRLAEERGAK